MANLREEDLLLDHEYDGIRELDNKLPPWWLYLFYITIIWAVVYMIHYHVLGTGDSSFEEYMKELDPQWTQMQADAGLSIGYNSPFYSAGEELSPYRRIQLAAEQRLAALREAAERGGEQAVAVSQLNFDELILSAMKVAQPQELDKLKAAFPELWAQFTAAPPAETVAEPEKPAALPPMEPLTDEASLAAGAEIYKINCATCHGAAGEGGIGPNLTDDYYMHGRGMASTVSIIVNGVAAKGMISWRGILKENQIKQVSSYILTLHGSNPANAKAPQGEKIEPETATAAAANQNN